MKSHSFLLLIIYASFVMLSHCQREESHSQKTMFEVLTKQESGIDFANILSENDSINYFNYGYIYMGGGVAIGDIDNDGQDDIYFTGNMVKNKLYLNQGNLKFKDISLEAGVEADKEQWITGATMIDINADGWLDIYVSVSGIWNSTQNLLYVNQGLNENNIPVFKEMAQQYGIDDPGNSVQGYFFDYDIDGDLDLYVINYPPTPFNSSLNDYRYKMTNCSDIESNTLYLNKGNNVFENITEEAGLKFYNLSLSAAIADYNKDGWMDIYVSNDFESLDNLFINNGNGTFTDHLLESFNQVSFYGMGTDVMDFDNDGFLDLFQLDMTPEDNRRSKANMQSMNIGKFEDMSSSEFYYQYMQNSLQKNMGTDDNGVPHFSNIARLSGVALTDWSWATLFLDIDNDGWKDLFVTNGSRREINNKDFFKKLEKENNGKRKEEMDLLKFVKLIPSEKIENFAYRNKGDLTFGEVSKDWGLNHKGFSNGTAYADLDNDGDLDLVVNNLDEESIVYRNTTMDYNGNNYLQIRPKGPSKNPFGIGIKATLYQQGDIQYQELMLSRGFQSSVPPILYFGLGKEKLIDSIKISWPDGKEQILGETHPNKQLVANYENAIEKIEKLNPIKKKSQFTDITALARLEHLHEENRFDDYFYQVLLPHKMSEFGPALTVADVDDDGLEDFFVGGASGQAGAIYKQLSDGSFVQNDEQSDFMKDIIKEDVDAVFFDANNDGYPDLYIVSGGNEFHRNTGGYQDRFYLNDKQGGFIKVSDALPEIRSSGSKVVPADFDQDGDLDLFVGGRHTPRNYPLPADSYILRNDTEDDRVKFSDITSEIAPDLINLGMVTDAVWADFNNDNALDLVLTGEWMPLTFFAQENGKFQNKTQGYGLEKTVGWWFSINADDFDNDGDVDFVAGNLGLNYKYRASKGASFDIYADDFDNNKSMDIVLGYYNDGKQYPVRGRQCSSQQIAAIEVKFKDYNSFAEADLADVYSTQSLESALHYQAYNFASSYVENLGNGTFKITPLPNEAQSSSINSILSKDVDLDGHLDLIISGNLYQSEVETPRNDAGYGLFLKGNGKGDFDAVPYVHSGLLVKGDVKNSSFIQIKKDRSAVLFAKNNDELKLVRIKSN